ncbi:hypothetical protein DFH09DRAFT_1080576 [Mycena vulgaris]|nr:hypothetical protein DFH09DRAFT_1080576 [Mycena vulgaris]
MRKGWLPSTPSRARARLHHAASAESPANPRFAPRVRLALPRQSRLAPGLCLTRRPFKACNNTSFAFAGVSGDDVVLSPCFPPPPRRCTSTYHLPTRTYPPFLYVAITTADADAEFTVGYLSRGDLFGRRADGSPLPASSRRGVEWLGASSPFKLPVGHLRDLRLPISLHLDISHRYRAHHPCLPNYLLPPHRERIIQISGAAKTGNNPRGTRQPQGNIDLEQDGAYRAQATRDTENESRDQLKFDLNVAHGKFFPGLGDLLPESSPPRHSREDLLIVALVWQPVQFPVIPQIP